MMMRKRHGRRLVEGAGGSLAVLVAVFALSAAPARAQEEGGDKPPPAKETTTPDYVEDVRAFLEKHEHILKLAGGALVLLLVGTRVYRMFGGGSSRPNADPTAGLFGRWRSEKRLAQLIAEAHYEDAADLMLMLDPNKVNEAAELLVKGKRYARAATMYLDRKNPKRAASCYEKGEQFDLAAELYEKAGDFQRAEDNYLKVKNKHAVARMYAQAGNSEKAALYFHELARPKEAAEHLEKLGKKREAAESYAQAYSLLATKRPGSGERDLGVEKEGKELVAKICKLYEELGEQNLAAEFLLKAGRGDAAAELYRKSGDLEKAAKVLQEHGHFEQAGRVLQEMGKEGEALRLFARVRQERGEHGAAAELYEKAGELQMSAELYEKAGKNEKAAAIYLQCRDTRRAADLFAKVGNYKKAAEIYESSKQYSAAVFCYEQLGEWQKVGEMWERLENFFLAGVTYFTCRLPERAVKTLERVKKDSDDKKEAERLLAIMLFEMKKDKECLPHFEAGFGRNIQKDDVEAFYYYCQALERFPDQHKKAISALETIQKLRPGYRDVAKRLTALKAGKPLPRTSIYPDGEGDPGSLVHTSRFSMRATRERERPDV